MCWQPMPSTPFFYVNNKKTDMRRILSTIFAILLTTSAFAQSHGNHIMVGVGGSYPQGVEATLAYEHETKRIIEDSEM